MYIFRVYITYVNFEVYKNFDSKIIWTILSQVEVKLNILSSRNYS